MSRPQHFPISMPLAADRETLKDFSSVLQRNLADLFDAAHAHSTRTSLPARGEGSVGDMVLATVSGSTYICIKTSAGWFRTSALTAL